MFASSVLGVALAIGLLPQDPSPKPKISAHLQEIVPAPGGKSGLRCQGTAAGFPEASRLDLTLYYEKTEDENIIARAVAAVEDGKFSYDFLIYPEKNLSGLYRVRVSYQPKLQPAGRQNLSPVDASVELQIGDKAAVRRDRAAFRAQLSEELRAVKGLVNEVLSEYQKPKEALDKKAWKRLSDGWRDRCLAIERRAHGRLEYRVLGLYEIVNSGLEHLRLLLMEIADCASRRDEIPLMEARIRFERVADNHLAELAPPPPNLPNLLREQADEAHRIVRGMLKLRDEAELARARRNFVGVTLLLGRHSPERFQDAIRQIAADGFQLFEALEYKTSAEAEIHARLEKKVQALQEGFKDLKDEDQ